MDRQPADGCDDDHLDDELQGEGRQVEVVPEEQDRCQVDNDGEEGGEHDLGLELLHLGKDVQELNEDERRESDADDVDEGVVEKDDGEEHDHGALVD